MELNLAGKVAIVTGAARGIGAATARAFIQERASVALLDVDEGAASLAEQLGQHTGSSDAMSPLPNK